ncbi:hypothetical protein TI01_1009 [Lysobacter sp. A03]|nr:hypothetical protein TI01_1009 [Lysobacter sp. A03]
MPAQQRPIDLAHLYAVVEDDKAAAIVGQQSGGPVERKRRRHRSDRRCGIQAEGLHRRPATHRQHFGQMRVLAVDNQAAAARHRSHQMVELALDRGHVGENVGVVELQIVEDRDQRAVVDELAALVEEGGVVLVRFDHELTARADARRDTEVLGHAADQEARPTTCSLQQPHEDRCRGGLAVGAGDRQNVPPRQHVFRQPLRAGGVVAAVIEHLLDRRIAPRERVADHDLVAVIGEIVRLVPLAQLDAQRFQQRGHRRIDRLVAAFHLMAQFAGERCHAAHERTGDTKDMQFHRAISRPRGPASTPR